MNYKDLIDRLRATGLQSAAEAADVIESLTAQLASGPCAYAHITLEDDGPNAELQVVNGENLQPHHSPVPLYFIAGPYGGIEMDKEEPLPCPICGSPALVGQTLDDAWYAMCREDKCIRFDNYWRTKPEAIAAWNRRT